MAEKKKVIPIFNKKSVNFSPASPITHFCASNKRLAIAMQNNMLLFIDLRNPEEPQEFDLKENGLDRDLSKMFMDPSGRHLLLSFSPKDQVNRAKVYFMKIGTPPKEVMTLKTHVITAVAWNKDSSVNLDSSYVFPFLIGTSKGHIYEAEINDGELKHCRLVYETVQGNNRLIITGLEYFFLKNSNQCFIFVATKTMLFQFKGNISKDERPCFANLFNSYINHSCVENCKEFSEASSGRLHIQLDKNDQLEFIIYASYKGLLIYSKEVIDGKLQRISSAGGDSLSLDFLKLMFIMDYKILKDPFPEAIVSTKFHVMMWMSCKNLFQLQAVCVLNNEVIFNEEFDNESENPIGIVKDPIEGIVWLYSPASVHRFMVSNEDRNVWKIYLSNKNFSKAEEFAKSDKEKMEEINTKLANHYFDNEEYDKSALKFTEANASFEEIALKFSSVKDTTALKTFLLRKLDEQNPAESTKINVLTLWLIEIYLNDLGTLRDFHKQDLQESANYNNLKQEFLNFLKNPTVKECVSRNKKVIYDLMSSHGDKEYLIHFTLVMKDHEQELENNIANGQFDAALKTLHAQKDPNLFAKYIPILLDKKPEATIDLLISVGRLLHPIKLLPKFSAKLDTETTKQITRYLEHCVNSLKMTEQSVHDYLLSLYIHFYPSKLLPYLKQQRVRYDPKSTLSMCLKRKLDLPSIHLYTTMGLYEEAVDLALTVDIEIAKKTASIPEGDEELRRKLWLKIARHVVKEKNDIKQAMEFLHQCDLLKIEDILPFFPDFVTIDHFKDAICESLQEYNRHIDELKEEMEEATKQAEVIREDINFVRNRCTMVGATDNCTLCSLPLFYKNFYVFPCGHQFHADCLLTEIFPTLSQPRKTLLNDLQRKLSDSFGQQDVHSVASMVISPREQIKSDIDDIIASECVYCGENMIKLIDVPFIPDDDFEKVQRDWE